jgi:hypothetical protein
MKAVEYRVNITTDHHTTSRGLFYYKDGGILIPTTYFKRFSVNIRQEQQGCVSLWLFHGNFVTYRYTTHTIKLLYVFNESSPCWIL